MYRDDWLLGQLEDLAACLAAVAGFRRRGQPAEARVELEATARRALGLDPAVLVALSLPSVLDLLAADEAPHRKGARTALAARLLAEIAAILHMTGDPSAEATARRARELRDAALAAGFDPADPPLADFPG